MRQKGLARYAACLVLIGALQMVCAAGCRLLPWEVGQHEASPDGRYDAYAMFHFDGNREWLVLKVVELSTRQAIWEQNLGDRKSTHAPFDQGFGHLDLIQWSGDSGEVVFAYSTEERDAWEITEWLIVDLSGDEVSTEIVPGSRNSVDEQQAGQTSG